MGLEQPRLPDERELLALPEDPHEGFIHLIEILQNTYDLGGGRYSGIADVIINEYIDAYIENYPGIVPGGMVVPRQGEGLEEFKAGVKRAWIKSVVKGHAKSMFARQLPQVRVRINDEYRAHIRELIIHIRRVLDAAEIPPLRKDEISGKLSAFAAEVEKEASHIERLGALWLAVTRYAGEGSKNLEPIVRLIERVRKVLGSAQDEQEHDLLIAREERKGIAPPSD